MKKLVYIAGPISRGNPFVNVHRACEMWESLRVNGIPAICPHWSALQELILPIPYDDWMAYDFDLIPHCSAVLRMPGESPGADKETALAERLGIPVFTDLDSLLHWWQNDCTSVHILRDTGTPDPLLAPPATLSVQSGGSDPNVRG